MATKRKLNETECLLIAAQINAIRTNYISANIDNTKKKSKCKLYGSRNETVNQIICECSKLDQKEYKSKYVWVVTVIHCELSKRLKFGYAKKCCTNKPESVQKFSGILRYKRFTRRQKSTRHLVDFFCSQCENKSKRNDRHIGGSCTEKKNNKKLSNLHIRWPAHD